MSINYVIYLFISFYFVSLLHQIITIKNLYYEIKNFYICERYINTSYW